MEYRPREETKPGIMELVSGILRDGTEIVAKEIMAARLEMRDELDKAKSSAVMIGTGAGALLIGGILLVFMLVYLLQELSGLDLWICYGIVGGLISLIGFIVLSVGKQRAAVTSLVPKESIEKAKEDARWITRNVKYETR
jgi:hypothetical protein